MTKRLTDKQHLNFREWAQRVGDSYDAILIFNALPPVEQQNICKRPWFSLTTGKPINCPLVPHALQMAELLKKGEAALNPEQRKRLADHRAGR